MAYTNDNIQNFHINKATSRAIEKRSGFVSKQSFNFAGHHIAGRDGFENLKVFNDDMVDDGVGIPMHPHINFEIVSVILSGEMEHRDNLGNDLTITTNEVKLMSAGIGFQHGGTCYNNTNFLQIWIVPNQLNTTPTITVQKFSEADRKNRWQLQVSPNAVDNVLTIKQNLYAYRGVFSKGFNVDFKKNGSHKIFMMPLKGKILLNEKLIEERDSAEFKADREFCFTAKETSDIWLMVQKL